ncbi:replication endonuclease [Yersinia enterocolitica]|nr:replication endonuclease [Yersinia enterocolitica]
MANRHHSDNSTTPERVPLRAFQRSVWLTFGEQSLPLREQIALHEARSLSIASRIQRDRARQERDEWMKALHSWDKTVEGVRERFYAQPFFIRQTFQNKIAAFRDEERLNAFFMNTVKNALLRLESVKRLHCVNSAHTSELSAYYHAVWPRLVEKDRHSILSLANGLAARINEMIYTECDQQPELKSDDYLHNIYCHLVIELFALRITAPMPHLRDWRKFNRPDFFSAAARLCSPEWWGRKLWRLRTQWREQQLRAVSTVHRFASPYISSDALQHWLHQRRKNLAFLQTHELVDDEGNVYSLEAMAMASISNPVLRRHELMARVSGVEAVANEWGDCGVFVTITTPSKYHANYQVTGAMNDKWNHSTVEEAHRYLMATWERAFAALRNQDLRPYGFRVIEPHHDGTPHLHCCLFMLKEQRPKILKILRRYFIAEDREELGKNLTARFKVEYIKPSKGTATSYAAKYISKNIDGYALEGEIDHETGRPLAETARRAMAWASTHRIRQYQFVGTPPVTPYRELRKLSNRMEAQLKHARQWKPGRPLLTDAAMDKVMAAADAGCFASYIKAQGGVLIPRKDYTVALAYEPADKPNAYGEITPKIFGIWSPGKGEDTKICTRLKTFTIRKKEKPKTVDLMEKLGTPCGTAAPWSSVNNSTEEKKQPENDENRTTQETGEEQEITDFNTITPKQRRALLRRLRQMPPVCTKAPAVTAPDELLATQRAQEKRQQAAQRRQHRLHLLNAHLEDIGENLPPLARTILADGGSYYTTTRCYRLTERGELLCLPHRPRPDNQQKAALFNERISRINQILAQHNAAPLSQEGSLAEKMARHNALLQKHTRVPLAIQPVTTKPTPEEKQQARNVEHFAQKMRYLFRQFKAKQHSVD